MTPSPDRLQPDFQSSLEKQKIRSQQLREEDPLARKYRLKKLKSWILGHMDEINTALLDDFKKPVHETLLSETFVVVNELNHAIRNLSRWTRPHRESTPIHLWPARSWRTYEPKGVCLIIAPWNFPFNLAVGPMVHAIAAGNAMMVKPSEYTPNTSQLIKQMCEELFQEDEVKVFLGGPDIGAQLLQLPFDHIFFTGSTTVGKMVMHAAADHMASVTLEMGGKTPTIIDGSANIQDAASKIVYNKMLNMGQTCIAPDYIMVEEGAMAPFLVALKNEINKKYNIHLGDTIKSEFLARLVNDRHTERIRSLIDDAADLGATIEGGHSELEDHYIGPTLITNTTKEMRVLKEEIFGPLLPIVPFKELEEVKQWINQFDKPLALYMYTRNPSRFKDLIKSTSAGGVVWNHGVIQFLHTGLSFGGVNHSGIGKSHGFAGFKAFSNEKPILRQRIGWTPSKFLEPPFSSFGKKMLHWMIRYL